MKEEKENREPDAPDRSVIESVTKLLLSLGDADILEAAVRDAKEQMTKKEVLEKHPYKIFKSSDGRWYTKVKTDKGLKAIKKAHYDDLLDALTEFYRAEAELYTLTQIYPLFLDYKIAETSDGNGNKLQWIWNTYYAGTKIANADIGGLTTKTIKEWLLEVLEERKLDRRHFGEFKSVINMMLDYAVEEGIIEHNPAREIHAIGKKHFYEKEEKPYDEQVFRKEVVEELIPLCFKQFEKTGNTAYYGVVLNFHLGLRVGELVALKPGDFDFDRHILRVRRMEKQIHYLDGDGVIRRAGYEVVSHTKSADGLRNILLTQEAEALAGMIIAENPEGFEWLFYSTRTRDRLKGDGINNVLRRINSKLNTPQKANHCIRKTDITRLFSDTNLSEDEIRRFAGHSDTSTTHRYYEFSEANNSEHIPVYSTVFHSDALTEILEKMS